MKYNPNHKSQDFARALGLDKQQETRLKNAIAKAYEQKWDKDGPNVDQINSVVAPYIKTMEEAYFVATIIVSDIMGAMQKLGKTFNNPEIN